ncbi:hypothetical protein A6M27_13235 [Acidithiobacillus thiooxidans]|uniref:Uncharacterized protein n=2 Tax=Acidithiobacillus thiooxidans TaxID=930 RepID=A0A1C2JBI5_ACITH|nr:hypothetical protein [Acidithiobacillus thiooxidans]OCX67476.1 hypothetical protein A6O24_20790 [Acidithiobacillus thiooxidans]OCX76919.1 hypothetical protein A6P07_01265 [Acidithiobacillus thiooxidans]OCX85593.1 hypothetical protein A6O26_00775 [Acidithiobacillus thiooxidans]OCX86255.1 hypothetical protein A6M27_13235 [Acidithiobacillus thiooxidans]OFC50718.1 hypothetical protein BAE47_01340 [Acidithiobacillus thiooxidans]
MKSLLFVALFMVSGITTMAQAHPEKIKIDHSVLKIQKPVHIPTHIKVKPVIITFTEIEEIFS